MLNPSERNAPEDQGADNGKRNVAVAPPYFDQKLRYSANETAALLRQSVSLTWRDIAEGKLKVIREGGRTYVPGSEIVRRSTLQELTS